MSSGKGWSKLYKGNVQPSGEFADKCVSAYAKVLENINFFKVPDCLFDSTIQKFSEEDIRPLDVFCVDIVNNVSITWQYFFFCQGSGYFEQCFENGFQRTFCMLPY